MTLRSNEIPQDMDTAALFADSLLFKALDDQGLNELRKCADLVLVDSGDTVIAEGEHDEYVYLVRKGSLSAWTSRTGREVKLGDLEPGSVFGEVAELGQTARTATVRAETDCELTRFQGNRFVEILGRYPKAREALTNIVLKRATDNIEKTT